MPTVTLWQRDSLHVTVSGGVDGLTFHAQDLDPPPMFGDEYEYGFSIAAADIPKLAQALGGSAPSEVLELLQASAQSVAPTVSNPGSRPMTSRSRLLELVLVEKIRDTGHDRVRSCAT